MDEIDTYLGILMAVDDGETTVAEVAEAIGLTPDEALQALSRLLDVGFVACPAGRRSDGLPLGFVLNPSGRILMRFGFDELYKRRLVANLGGEPHSAS